MAIGRTFGYGDFTKVIPLVEKLVTQAHAWDIKTVFVAGSSAQPFAYLFKQLWTAKYAEPLPHFLAFGQSPTNHATWKKRLATFAQKNPQLTHMPSMLFDEFAMTGNTMRQIHKEVRSVGFGKVKTAVLGINQHSSLQPDFVGIRGNDHRGGYEYLTLFAGQRSDIISMAKERRSSKEKYAFGETLANGKAFLKDLRVKSKQVAMRKRVVP